MAGLAAAALIGAAGSALATGGSLAANKKEQQKNREYNLRLAQMQNQWNYENWQMNNAYNTPSAQKARLEAAGLNADMMYGQGGISNISNSAPESTSGAPSSPVDWSSLASINPVDKYLDAQLMQAQIDNVNADTEKKGHEASILASDASYRDAWNRGLLETQNVSIRLGNAQTDKEKSADQLNKQNIKESQARITEIQARTKEIGATIQSIFNAIRNDNARLEIDKALSEANIKKAASSTSLDYATAKSISDQLEHVINNLKSDNELKNQQKINLGHEGEILLNQSDEAQFNATIRTFEGWDSDMTFYQNASKFVLQLLHGISSFIPGAKGITR